MLDSVLGLGFTWLDLSEICFFVFVLFLTSSVVFVFV